MKLIESWTDAGRPYNEDAVGATPTAAWVIDGTKGPFEHTLTPGPTDATWHSQALNAVLAKCYVESPADPMACLAQTAQHVAEAYARNATCAPPHEQPSACLALAALAQSGQLHLFNIGDCRILIEKAGTVCQFGTSDIEPLETAAIGELVRLREIEGEDVDPWPLLRTILRRNFAAAMNKPGGYWVVHPTLSWLHAVQHTELSAADVDHVLIMSDGFYRLVNVFGVYNKLGLLAAALRPGGLAALGIELRSREADDPTCVRYPRLKAMDDATAVFVSVQS
jgi:serine/threonine protein phosphatase PrpC